MSHTLSQANSQQEPRSNPADGPLQEFDANALPLSAGLRLLEASAGTGKTFALAHLVLRLVTEPHLKEQPLAVRELLVVTFTEAAAAELRDRIGRRFQQALEALETLQTPAADRPATDAVLAGWLEQWPTDTNVPQLRARLLLALEELDAADITTIHGFCHRNLRRQALEAGLGPQLEVETEGAELAEQVVHDYWHSQVLPLPLHLLQGLKRAKVTPASLAGLLQQLEGDAALTPPPLPDGWQAEAPLQGQLTGFWSEVWEQFKPLWAARGEALEQAFCASAKQWKALGASATTPYAGKPRTKRVEELSAWLAAQPDPGSYAELQIDKHTWLPDYFHPGVFTKVAQTFETPPVSLPQQLLLEAVAALVDGPAEAVLAHFCHWGAGELRSRRQRAGRISYGELLRGLDPGPSGTERVALIEALRRRYRAALIDEFQDTDPIQWRTLRQAFAPDLEASQHLLVIVGDPKQAIYRFRGGDLDTYLAARQLAGEPSIRGMRHNFRASGSLVAALNRLMAPGLVRTGLPVPAVIAQPQRQSLQLRLPPGQAPLQLLWLGPEPGSAAAGPKLPSKTELEKTLPEQIGALTLDLLQRGIEVCEHGEQRALEPGDICLLVSRHSQADALRRALEERGIASRLVSKGDVFESEGAAALQRLLDALAEPSSGPRQRLLAASPLLGWSPRRLTAASPTDWDALAGRLARLAEGLGPRGLLGVLAELLAGEGLGRLSQSGRLLADLQQCAELVQEQMHNEQLGAVAAADWLRRRRRHPPNDPPERHQPHSDAVESAVRVVTVHRSKGLEFPVVICPYLWQAPQPGSSTPGVRWTPPGAAAPSLDISLDPRWGVGRGARQQKHLAEAQEAERLAYVALTRAMQLLVLVYGPAKDQAANPLRPWLFPDQPLGEPGDDDPSSLALGPGDALSGLSWIQLPAEAAAAGRWQHPPRCGSLCTGPVPQRLLDGNWGRSSYSSWTHSSSGGAIAPAALEEGRETDANTAAPPIGAPAAAPLIEAAASASSDPASSGAASPDPASPDPASPDPAAHGPLQDFPRGPGAGDCLHRILEQVDHQRPAIADPATAALVELELERAGIGVEQRDAVLTGLEQLRLTPMGGALRGFRLADLPLTRRLNEMNFDLPLATQAEQGTQSQPLVRAAGLAAPFRDHPSGAFGAAYASQLELLPVASRGFLTGSIDLVFTAPDAAGEVRWWVADWKSNWLGERSENGQPLACGPLHYSPQAMAALMAANHYPLQAHLYLVALHRYLRWRLPHYTPERHLGGYVYVFLRGVPGEHAQVGGPGAAVPGMFVEMADPGRLLALDDALREGQP